MTQTFSNNQPNVNNSNVVLAAQPSEMGAKEMSSLEIAELTGKQHAHVMRDIRTLIEQGVNESNFGLVDYIDKKGEKRSMYKLTKKGSLILASGYNAVLREKIIDRWEALETGNATPAYQKMPTAKELALMVIQAEEEKERLMLENKAQQEVIESQKPAVVFTSAVQAAVNSCLVGELAKILQQNGVNIGEKRLFKWLRENKYLGSHGERYNIPNQEYIERGYFELKKGTRSGDNGVMHTTITTKVTGKGQVYFVNKFLANKVKED
jgi:anti-repressor protein